MRRFIIALRPALVACASGTACQLGDPTSDVDVTVTSGTTGDGAATFLTSSTTERPGFDSGTTVWLTSDVDGTTEEAGSSTSSGAPGDTTSGGKVCAGGCAGDTPVCDPAANGGKGACVQCLADDDCDDAYACSLDTCTANACTHAYDDSLACQPSWSVLAPPTAVSGRAWADMAFDAAHEEAVMFGGLVGGAVTDETWRWDGGDWTAAAPATSPPARFTHAMVYDEAREVVVMYGGMPAQFSNSPFTDTWEWDGTTWTEVVTANSPTPARTTHHNMTYDPTTQRVLLFGGGTTPGQTVYGDVWEYDGLDWTQLDTGTGPEPRIASCVGWVAGAGGMVVAGGGWWDPYYNDTWVWDGAWTEIEATGAWSTRQSALCAYDSFRDRLVMQGGGENIDLVGDTWEFDGTGWTQHNGAGPGATCCAATTYDSVRRQVVSHIGGETWVFGP